MALEDVLYYYLLHREDSIYYLPVNYNSVDLYYPNSVSDNKLSSLTVRKNIERHLSDERSVEPKLISDTIYVLTLKFPGKYVPHHYASHYHSLLRDLLGENMMLYNRKFQIVSMFSNKRFSQARFITTF